MILAVWIFPGIVMSFLGSYTTHEYIKRDDDPTRSDTEPNKESLSANNVSGFRTDGEVQQVLVNSTAQIKCDVSSNLPNDQVLLVVWYKNNLPIYSYDTRGTHAETPSHWKDEEVLENRAVFRTMQAPAELIIEPVSEKDAGNFRCRVDFKLSPTRNNNVNLEVVVPPQIPRIFNERGEHIESRAGPYEEGGDLNLVCVVMGGVPKPKITWSRNGQILQSTMLDFSFPSALNSKLVIKNLSRVHQHAVYTCQANNFHKGVVTTNITIELYLRPLEVEISLKQQPFSADRRVDIPCQAVGSRPPAKITWWMEEVELSGHVQKVSNDGNVSTSILQITPTRQDNEKMLVCKALNELVKKGIKEATYKMDVHFAPTLQLELGSNLNPEDIEEGDDVYFECKIESNPEAYKVVWKHNGQAIQHNQKAGVIVSHKDLAFQGVTRSQAGNYTCFASNVEGDGESNTVELNVMYRPTCRVGQKMVYGLARHEAAEIFCEVDAFPPPESFKWKFNNTAEIFDMPPNGFQQHALGASKLIYTPIKEMDFGTIMCWADNVVGQQKEPCVFHLIAAGKPDTPYNCSLINQTSDSLEVECTEGFDGGQSQWFIMEIYDHQTGILKANISSKAPIFTVGGLDAGRLLKILIYAVNIKGKSGMVLVEAFTLKAAEKQTGPYNHFELTPVLSVGIFIGVLTALLCIALGTVAVIKLRTTKHQPKSQMHVKGKSPTRPGNLTIKKKISLPQLNRSESEVYDEKNPDVVPCNEEPEYKLKSTIHTPAATASFATSGIHQHEHSVSSQNNNSRFNQIQSSNDLNQPPQYINGKQQNMCDDKEVHYAGLALLVKHQLPNMQQQSADQIRSPDTTKARGIVGGGGNEALTPGGGKQPSIVFDYFDEATIYAKIDQHFKMSAKPFSNREIVTIRTPLLFTQQESCV